MTCCTRESVHDDATAASARPEYGCLAAGGRRRGAATALVAAVCVGLVVLGVVLSMPLVQKTVNEFGLPLTDAGIIRQQAAEKHLDPALIAAVIYAETKFDPRTSAAGALGLMQIMPQTAEYLARRSGATTFTIADLGTPRSTSPTAATTCATCSTSTTATDAALAAYNGGESNVDRWVAAARAHGHALTVAEIPFPETRAYVAKVLQAQREYRSKYAAQLYG